MELNSFLAMLINGFYSIVNFLIDGVCLILPTFSISDFLSSSLGAFAPFLGAINYFVPFTQMIAIAAAWVSAITIWYVVQFVLRFVQLGS